MREGAVSAATRGFVTVGVVTAGGFEVTGVVVAGAVVVAAVVGAGAVVVAAAVAAGVVVTDDLGGLWEVVVVVLVVAVVVSCTVVLCTSPSWKGSRVRLVGAVTAWVSTARWRVPEVVGWGDPVATGGGAIAA